MKIPKIPGMNMMKQLQDVMDRAQALEAELANDRLDVTAGGGAIKATFSGTAELVDIKISKDVVDPEDIEMLEDLIKSVVREGNEKALELRQKKTAEIQSLMPNIPGMKMPF
jgi:DNA-binding YbaB/EbfC family protein